jgi:hypothetical protein
MARKYETDTLKDDYETTGDKSNTVVSDADDSRGKEHPDAQKVRDGELSAAQLGSHADENDVITPAGYIENS